MKPLFARGGGILMHLTSLPNDYGIGSWGSEAFDFVDFLVESGIRYWQIFPLGPTGYGDSPYQSFSAFALNPLLIDISDLIEHYWLHYDEVDIPITWDAHRIDYGRLIPWKDRILRTAFSRFDVSDSDFSHFCETEAQWLDSFALFMTLKNHFQGKNWHQWPHLYRLADQNACAKFRQQNLLEIQYHQFLQFVAFRQWHQLKMYSQRHNIKIIGDLPIFIAADSADVWANQSLFQMDAEGNASAVAGVPPDYFSATGQLWGNPLYRWSEMEKNHFQWWKDRFRQTLRWVDWVRLDHFRGFVHYWSVPATELTAINGEWKPGPGKPLFDAFRDIADPLPIIAEDLGIITPDVEMLRDELQFPGMKILQFAFDSGLENKYLPHHYPQNTIVYTGTHDNDTTCGWLRQIDESKRQFIFHYLNIPEDTSLTNQQLTWQFIELAWKSEAQLAIAPLQDFLLLGSEARMNFPGKASDNWQWRILGHDLTASLAQKIYHLNYKSNR